MEQTNETQELFAMAAMLEEMGVIGGHDTVTYAPVDYPEDEEDGPEENRWGRWVGRGGKLIYEVGTKETWCDKEQWEAQEVSASMETVAMPTQATPVEELLATVGILNTEAMYRGTPLPHDFRMFTDASKLLYKGLPVVALRFPPSKLDLIPDSVVKNLSRNVSGKREVVTGTGRHLFMGAIACDGEPEVVFSVTTMMGAHHFLLRRSSIEEVGPQPEQWRIGGTVIFSADGCEQWHDAIPTKKSAVVYVDGNYWWVPYDKWVPVLSTDGVIHDRNRTPFKLPYQIPDGTWEVNLATAEYRPTTRPPVSYEILRAWQKMSRLHSVFYADAPEERKSFPLSATNYDLTHVPQCFNENATLMSLHMRSTLHKPKGMRMLEFLQSQTCGDGRAADAFHFYAWSMNMGWLWSTMDMYHVFSDTKDAFGGLVVRVPLGYCRRLEQLGAQPTKICDEYVLLGAWRFRNALSSMMKPGTRLWVRRIYRRRQ